MSHDGATSGATVASWHVDHGMGMTIWRDGRVVLIIPPDRFPKMIADMAKALEERNALAG